MLHPLITILGPTATGKTKLAVSIADAVAGEIISADSRQVYKDMDIGTGKDLSEYIIKGKTISYHIINMAEAGEAYNVHRFVKDFWQIYNDLKKRGTNAVMCGGTGMYIEAILRGYNMPEVPENIALRKELKHKTDGELVIMLRQMKKLHNTTDITDRERLIRALEIETYCKTHNTTDFKACNSVVFGLELPRELIRERITKRLHQRLESGMVQEVQMLIEKGVNTETLKYYGLEYKFITRFLLGELSYDHMVKLLNTAIHQFAKRQQTWFKRMNRNGITIHSIDGRWHDDEKRAFVIKTLQNNHS